MNQTYLKKRNLNDFNICIIADNIITKIIAEFEWISLHPIHQIGIIWVIDSKKSIILKDESSDSNERVFCFILVGSIKVTKGSDKLFTPLNGVIGDGVTDLAGICFASFVLYWFNICFNFSWLILLYLCLNSKYNHLLIYI